MPRGQAHCRYAHADLASLRRVVVAGIDFEGALADLAALVALLTLVAAFVARPAVLAAAGLEGFDAACATFASVFAAIILGALAMLILADVTRFAVGPKTTFAAGLRT
jgi:hypothetical protein